MQTVHPITPKPPRTGLKVFALLCTGLVLLTGGVSGGYWFARNYEIVPKAPLQADSATYDTTSPLGSPLPSSSTTQRSLAREGAGDDTSAHTSTTPDAPLQARGPFSYRFKPGEQLVYTLNTNIAGEGMEMLAPSGVLMDFDSLLTLTTKSVDRSGNGTLVLAFEETSLQGDFMDSPYEMQVDPNQARISQQNKPILDVAQGLGSVMGIPQLEFFQAPITMKVAPGGAVLDVSNSQGLAAMLAAAPSLASIEFPQGPVATGDQWESNIALPVPGFGQAAQSRIVNTLVGYEYVGDRICGVIEQEFLADQANGTVNMPESSLGEALQLSMPIFQLEGTNRVYFDTEQGQLVKADLDLNLLMNFSQMLGNSSGGLGALLGSLGPLLGGENLDGLLDQAEGRAPRQPVEQNSLLELSLKITGGMELLPE